jgi:hypothetical protein
MIDRFILRPILKVGTWVKRHPAAALVIVLLLWLVPPFVSTLAIGASTLIRAVNSVLGLAVATQVAKGLSAVITWFTQNPKRAYWLAALVGFFSPLIGAVLALWLFLDRFKPAVVAVALPLAPGPTPPTADDKQNETSDGPIVIRPDFSGPDELPSPDYFA